MNWQRRTILVMAVIGCIGFESGARADIRKGEFLFGPYGLYTIPTDDYPSPRLDDVPYFEMGNKVDPGPGVAAAVDRMMSSRLSIGGEFKVYFSTVDEDVLQDFIDTHVAPALTEAEVTWRTVHLGARARYYLNPAKRVNPFLQAGAGLYVSKLRAEFRQARGNGSTNDFSRSQSTTDPGISLGPGVLVRISRDTRLSVDAIFTNVFSPERNVRYLGLSLGLIFGMIPY